MKKSRLLPPYDSQGRTTFSKRNKPGVYIIYKNDTPVYIGFSAKDTYKALYRHFQTWNDRTQQRVTYRNLDNIKVRVIYTNTAGQAAKLEKALIIKLKPTDNPKQYWLTYDTDEKEEAIYQNFVDTDTSPIKVFQGDVPF
jgi:hypothetical protein